MGNGDTSMEGKEKLSNVIKNNSQAELGCQGLSAFGSGEGLMHQAGAAGFGEGAARMAQEQGDRG